MIGNFFRTQKDKKKVPVRVSFRPFLESLEERVALDTSLAAQFQAFATQPPSSTQATSSATSTPAMSNIMMDMVNVGTAAQALMTAESTANSTNITTDLATYMSAITTLFSDISALYQSSSSSVTSPSSYNPATTGGNQSTSGTLIPLPSSSQTSQPSLSNAYTTPPYADIA